MLHLLTSVDRVSAEDYRLVDQLMSTIMFPHYTAYIFVAKLPGSIVSSLDHCLRLRGNAVLLVAILAYTIIRLLLDHDLVNSIAIV